MLKVIKSILGGLRRIVGGYSYIRRLKRDVIGIIVMGLGGLIALIPSVQLLLSGSFVRGIIFIFFSVFSLFGARRIYQKRRGGL